MRVKICGIRNEKELEAAARSGADAVGFLVGQVHPSGDFILPGTAARLVRHLPPGITPVIVTHLTEPEEILEIVDRTGIMTLQLHGGSTPEQVVQLRSALPPAAKLIVMLHLTSENDFEKASDFFSSADAFLSDTFDAESGRVGGTGKTHDWELVRRFRDYSRLPVILAGGLGPDNVAEAIRTVHPYAVDANSHLKTGDGVDAALCAAFVAAARSAQ